MVRAALVGAVLGAVLSLPAYAQQTSSIAGIVRDTSGAVLPGVTVEATSPVLIEKIRTVVSDEQGRYNISDLLPGSYQVTFRLQGFSTVRREGITLTSGFTATVSADLQVGLPRGDDHGERRLADRRHVERPPPDRRLERAARDAAGQHQEHPVARDADARLVRRRRRGRPLYRRGGLVPWQARHQGVVRQHGDREQRRQQQLPDQLAGGLGNGRPDERRHRRGERRRPGDEHHSPGGQQQVQRHRQLAVHQLEPREQQPQRRAAESRVHERQQDVSDVGSRRHDQRPDHAGQGLVPGGAAHVGLLASDRRRLLESRRRTSS